MRVGIKIYSTDPATIFDKLDFADYIELFIVPGQPINQYKDYDFTYILHAAHSMYNVNLASEKCQEYSINTVKEALNAADILNSKIIIVHPGSSRKNIKNDTTSTKLLQESLSQLRDPRVVLENLPYTDKLDYAGKPDYHLAYDYSTMKKYSGIFSHRICLDFSHAMVSAIHLRRDHKILINNLLKLDVQLFHISDGITSQAQDLHLPLFKGNFDLDYFKSIVNNSKCKTVTLETAPPDTTRQKKEYEWLKA